MSNTNKKITSPRPLSYRANTLVLARRGFTLIEATVVMLLVFLISSISLAMLNQQFLFYQTLQRQNFLVQEAPVINGLLSRILSQADAFRLHANEAQALDQSGAVIAGGNTILLGYAQADGSRNYGMITFVAPADGQTTGELIYTNITDISTETTSDSWVISSQVANAAFAIDGDGILTLTLGDQFQSQVTYAGIASF